MNLLILGGTAFLGRQVAIEALSRGHDITCLARGSAPPPDGARFVRADRDEPGGLAEVRDTRWDAVLDVSRQPGQVRRAVAELRVAHWVFVSTANVYADVSRPQQTEDGALLPPLEADVMSSMEEYGPAKVACERAFAQGAAGAGASATLARVGLIGGPGDDSWRVSYWAWRFANPSGPDVIVPDDLDFPVAFIDVRDLAAWLVGAAEQRVDGPVNVTGPVAHLGDLLADAARAAGSDVPMRPVAPARLAELGVNPWMGPRSLPLWIDDPDWRHFAGMDTSRAVASGLHTRPYAETFADALRDQEARGGTMRSGLSDEEEREIRAALAGR